MTGRIGTESGYPHADPHVDTNEHPTRHCADVWLSLPKSPGLRWARPSRVMPRGPWLRTFEKARGRAAWFMVPVALG